MPAGRSVDPRLTAYDVEFLDLEAEGLNPQSQERYGVVRSTTKGNAYSMNIQSQLTQINVRVLSNLRLGFSYAIFCSQSEETKPGGQNGTARNEDRAVTQIARPPSSSSEHFSSNGSLSHHHTPRDLALPPTLLGRSSPLKAYSFMVMSFLCGTILAIGHHLFYQALDGQRVPDKDQFIIAGNHISSQQTTTFAGTAFVFFAKFCFSFSLGHVFNQRLWYTAHRKSIKVKGLDAMFKVPGDPFGFFSLEMMTRAKTVAGVAGVIWCLPLAFVPIPGSLSVKNMAFTTFVQAIVPTVNITDPAVNFGAVNPLGTYRPPYDSTDEKI